MASEFSLEAALRKKRKGAEEHIKAYEALKLVFEREIHPQITAAASGTEVFLTDHGPQHIARVINRASKLVSQSNIKLSTYEIFILLVAIHLHDIGNAMGRKEHEKNADKIFDLAYGPLGFDQLNRVMASQIASVHGGKTGSDRDTIRGISEETMWRNEPIRPQYLAAILRLADELAEDRHRANAMAIALDRVPKRSEIYHVYARGVHSFEPDARSFTIDLKTAYATSLFSRTFGKEDKEVHLLDEILAKALKAYQEAMYCSRYLRGGLRFDRVRVTIDIFDDAFRTLNRTILFSLEEHGYRLPTTDEIFRLSPELADYEGKGRLTAARLQTLLGGVDASAA